MGKRIAIGVLVAAIAAASAFAGGDKNCLRHQGDKGQGAVVQNQIRLSK